MGGDRLREGGRAWRFGCIPYLVKSMLASASASALQLRPKLCVSSNIWHREVGWKNQAQLSLKTNFEMYGYRMNESLSRVFNIGSQNKVNCFFAFFKIRLEAKFAKSYDDQNHCYVVISFEFWLRQSIFTHVTSIYANLFGTKESFYVRKKFNSDRIGLGHQHGGCYVITLNDLADSSATTTTATTPFFLKHDKFTA